MSVNRYNASTGELENIASGQRTWVGTQAAYKAAKQAGTLPNNVIIAITDDEQDYNHYSTEETFTGMYWIDGKKIYRKVLILNNPSLAWQGIDVTADFPNIDQIWKENTALLERPNGTKVTEYVYGPAPTNDYFQVAIANSVSVPGDVKVYICSSNGNAKVTICFLYTKTTD